MTKQSKQQMLAILADYYAEAKTALIYHSPFEFLVAVVLSAQCTDERVNKVTARIFPQLNSPEKMLALGQEKLEQKIKDCGLFRSKAKNLMGTCRILVNEYNGQVPQTLEELLRLPGVGRKTANVLLSVLFGVPAIAVDTHVFRVSNRLKLASGKNPLEVEQKLMKVIPRDDWAAAHHWLIWHGRRICKARKPLCNQCPLAELCPSSFMQ